MQLIDLYIQEVGRHLPEKMRADIQQEIRSTIEDTLDDQAQQAGTPPTDEMVVEVLKKLGPPDQVATSYLPPRYLIGPTLYPAFVNTARIVLPIVVILTALGAGLSFGQASLSASSAADAVGGMVGSIFDGVFHALGILVVIFAILQYTAPQLGTRLLSRAWDPRQMKAGTDPERVKYGEIIVEAIFTLIAIVLFNFYPQFFSLNSTVDGHWVSVPVLTSVFFQYLPWLTALWALEVGFDAALVMRGHWDTLFRWMAIGLQLITIVLLTWIASGPSVVGIDPQALVKLGWNFNNPQWVLTASQGLEIGVRIALGITIVTSLIKLVKKLYDIFLRDRLQLAGVAR